MNRANCAIGSLKNVIHKQTGVSFSRKQCWSICSIPDNFPKAENTEDMSSTDKLINMLKEKDMIIMMTTSYQLD